MTGNRRQMIHGLRADRLVPAGQESPFRMATTSNRHRGVRSQAGVDREGEPLRGGPIKAGSDGRWNQRRSLAGRVFTRDWLLEDPTWREVRAHQAAGERLERGRLSLARHGQDRRRRRGYEGISGRVAALLPSLPRQRASQDRPFRHVTSGRLRGPRTACQEQCARQGKNQQMILELAS